MGCVTEVTRPAALGLEHMDAVEVQVAIAEVRRLAGSFIFDQSRFMAGKAKAVVAAIIAGVVAGGVVFAKETRLHGAVGCVTSVTRVVQQGLVDVG